VCGDHFSFTAKQGMGNAFQAIYITNMTSPAYHPYPFEAAFSEAVVLDGLIYLSGHIGDDDDGNLAQDFEAEVRQMMANVKATLARFDRTVTALVSVKVMLTDTAQVATFDALFADYFDGAPLPACTTFGVAALALNAAVEIECIAKL
jgi:2-iminobutanoate/2-iminopropanoate deaminase